MYHCAQLDCFFSVDVYLGATSVILPGPDPAALLATIERERVDQAVLPADGVDLAAAPPRLRHPRPVLAAQGLLRRLGDAGGGAARAAAPAARRRALELLRADRDGPAGHHPAPARAAAAGRLGRPRRRSTSRPGWWTTRTSRCRPARSARSCTAARTPRWATTTTRRRRPRRSAAAGSTPATWACSSADGYLSVVDRKKDMIKTGGENVASREVEEAIYQLDGVAEVAVFGIAHPHWIEAVTAVVVPKAGAALTAEQVDAHAREHLAGYKRPKYVVLADALPKNPSGKILKRELRAAARRARRGRRLSRGISPRAGPGAAGILGPRYERQGCAGDVGGASGRGAGRAARVPLLRAGHRRPGRDAGGLADGPAAAARPRSAAAHHQHRVRGQGGERPPGTAGVDAVLRSHRERAEPIRPRCW